MTSLNLKALLPAVFAAATFSTMAIGQDDALPQTLFTNVHVFDGVNEARIENASVLVEGNLIKEVSTESIDAPGATMFDGGGRTLMPGLIDGHTHFFFAVNGGVGAAEQMHWQYLGAMGAYAAKEHLHNGFTTVREAGGGAVGPGLKQAIDEGYMEGPRIYPSGAWIGQTSGHQDFVTYGQFDQTESNLYRLGISINADGADEVTAAVRKNLSLGASQIKIMISGGVSSVKDPLHSSQMTEAEIRAAVDAAAAWDTYVMTHVYNDSDIKRALEYGVKSIEHGQFMTDETAKLAIEKGAFIVSNLAGSTEGILQHPAYSVEGSPVLAKTKQFLAGVSNYKTVVNDNPDLKMVFQTDLVFTLGHDLRRGIDFEKWVLTDYLGNLRALRAMTSTAGELMALSGKQNPYPEKLGVIEPGAYADILIVDGNPLEDITVIGANSDWLGAPDREEIATMRIIMKDGVIYKNTLN
ncbi:amidohydrolase family protein [Tropicimonas sp. TH_r6]|uniref:metal-dependent hydrolase family protein n=1 Tax=Tropicimonas sp. TH_r6 TaxID=3082085 RepID=UPI0029555C4F|nr:amidohydrolase family protein [Tropicimonas sp. TH_r6]MDV7144917.1 amidohydrolase family protein [Tropicimonas sp. TH_r6]